MDEDLSFPFGSLALEYCSSSSSFSLWSPCGNQTSRLECENGDPKRGRETFLCRPQERRKAGKKQAWGFEDCLALLCVHGWLYGWSCSVWHRSYESPGFYMDTMDWALTITQIELVGLVSPIEMNELPRRTVWLDRCWVQQRERMRTHQGIFLFAKSSVVTLLIIRSPILILEMSANGTFAIFCVKVELLRWIDI